MPTQRVIPRMGPNSGGDGGSDGVCSLAAAATCLEASSASHAQQGDSANDNSIVATAITTQADGDQAAVPSPNNTKKYETRTAALHAAAAALASFNPNPRNKPENYDLDTSNAKQPTATKKKEKKVTSPQLAAAKLSGFKSFDKAPRQHSWLDYYNQLKEYRQRKGHVFVQ